MFLIVCRTPPLLCFFSPFGKRVRVADPGEVKEKNVQWYRIQAISTQGTSSRGHTLHRFI